jgi:alkyl sulfatase BDS1-like metallo-beta-lactamase superfamily hydrolase
MAGKQDAPKDATSFTKKANQMAREHFPPGDQRGYEDAWKGLIEQVKDLVIENERGDTVWSLTPYVDQMSNPPPASPPDCPDTVNPSLWRQATLNSIAGLFEVVEGIYQVRAFDMSNMTIIESDTGVVLIDPLISNECAEAALALYRKHRPRSGGVRGVIYTHSHVDHFGGVRGVVSDEALENGAKILAPAGFMEHAVSENVFAGVAMARRAEYMYGPYLAPGNKGQIDAGLGKGQSTGTISLIKPNIDITHTGQVIPIDGLEIEFQMTPGSEAPAEMNFYFPRYKALCTAENTTHNMHNIQTLRGARVRDALLWSKYLNEAMNLFGHRTEVLFAQHHWPVWNKDPVDNFLKKQRDLYRYLNDQTLRLLNKGYTGIEIAETFRLSPGLEQDWSCRGYYGSVSHNVKGVYDRYMGWFNGNPSMLHALPPTESSPRYVEAMGGTEAVIAKAAAAFERGEYRWVAELVGHVVFDRSDNPKAKELQQRARNLQADALEQLGYQAEPATWRNFYLMGAQELRGEIQKEEPTFSRDMIVELSNEMIFDMFGAQLNGTAAAERQLVMTWNFTDITDPKDSLWKVEVSNGALSSSAGVATLAGNPDVQVKLERSALDEVLLGEKSLEEVVREGRVTFQKGEEGFLWFFSLIEQGDPNFPIVTPKVPALPKMLSTEHLPAEVVNAIKKRRLGLARPVLKGC